MRSKSEAYFYIPLNDNEVRRGHVLKKSRGRRQFVTIGGRCGADLGYHGNVKKVGGVRLTGLSNLCNVTDFLLRKSKLQCVIYGMRSACGVETKHFAEKGQHLEKSGRDFFLSDVNTTLKEPGRAGGRRKETVMTHRVYQYSRQRTPAVRSTSLGIVAGLVWEQTKGSGCDDRGSVRPSRSKRRPAQT